MPSFIDRKGENLNKKVFQVSEIERDSVGEIIKIKAIESRDDLPIEVEGTALNADNLNSIVNGIVSETKYQMFEVILSSYEIVSKDKELLNLPSEIFYNLELPSRGFCGSYITWSVISGLQSAYELNNNNLNIKRFTTDVYITLRAYIYKDNENDYKDFNIKIKKYEDASNCIVENVTIDITYDEDAELEYHLSNLINNTTIDLIKDAIYYEIEYEIIDNKLSYAIKGKNT